LSSYPAEPQDELMKIDSGTFLLVTTASGDKVRMRAIGVPVRGKDFPVVWVCVPEEYDSDEPLRRAIPWPLDAVEVMEDSAA
jgi:hypothetical protein